MARESPTGRRVGTDVPAETMRMLCQENLKVPARVWRDAF